MSENAIVEALAVTSGAAIAVGGWIVNGVLARRAARRQLRLEFLLSAYRRLDDVTERTMTGVHERAMESALSDVLLLGTKRQIQLADEVCRGFASTRSAHTGDLLEALRQDLRAELQLERVPRREVWLRIDRDDSWVAEVALVRARVAGSMPAAPLALNERDAVSHRDEYGQSLVAAHDEVIADLAAVLSESGFEVPGTPDAIVAKSMAEHLIAPPTADAVEGLTVLRNLAERDPRSVSRERLDDYVALCAATRTAVRLNVTHRSP